MAVVGTEDNRKKILKQFFRIISFNKQMAVINKYYTIYLARHSDRSFGLLAFISWQPFCANFHSCLTLTKDRHRLGISVFSIK